MPPKDYPKNTDSESFHSLTRNKGVYFVKRWERPIPPDLTEIAPTESISIDYASYDNQDILVIKDRSSGYIGAVLTNQPQNQ